jgi:hypothetical protein
MDVSSYRFVRCRERILCRITSDERDLGVNDLQRTETGQGGEKGRDTDCIEVMARLNVPMYEDVLYVY